MESNTKVMSINKDYHKELELNYGELDKSKEESTIRINYMALPRLHMQMVALIGGNSRIVREKDMEQERLLMETDTSGNT